MIYSLRFLFNKIRKLRNKFFVWLENALFLQSVCILASTPILYGWAMPCSKMTILGNIIFSPFMVVFIFLSAFIFIFGLIGFYPKIIYLIFDSFMQIWRRVLAFGSHNWLTIPDFVALGIWAFGILGVTFLIIKDFNRSIVRYFCICWMLVFSAILILPVHLGLFYKGQISFPYKKETGLVFKRTEAGQILCIDDGVFGRSQEPAKFVLYKMRPFLLKKLGTLNLECLTLRRLSRRSLRAAIACCQFLNLSKVKICRLKSDYYQSHKAEIDELIDILKQKTTVVFGQP